MIGGRRPLRGRKPADRRVRVDRPHAPYFRYTGPGQLVAKAAANQPKTALGRTWARHSPGRLRPPARQRGGDRRAPVEEEGARDLQLGRDLVLGVRNRGDPAGPRPRRRRRGPRLLARGRGRDLDPPGRRRPVLPPGLPGLPIGRRRVLGVEGEPRRPRQPDRRGGPADRLRDDGRGVDAHRPSPRSTRSSRESSTSGSSSPSSRSSSSRRPTCAACASRATSSRSRPTCSSASP